jgi:2-polyprenyl-3-methyl-5-hydroxy-6-metoxy-1,4-benzoquinol methylase
MDSREMIPATHPHIRTLVQRQILAFPEHEAFLRERFSSVTETGWLFVEEIAATVMQIAGDRLDRVCEDYRWLSGIVLDEELHFRRTGRYRLSTFEQADRAVYSSPEMMSRYMNGLLASQLWWRNHTEMLNYFRDQFVEHNPVGFSHLEIGPGHGLLLYLAAVSRRCGRAEAWDISDASISNTRHALNALHLSPQVLIGKVDLFDAPDRQFSSIAFSEVLEHLERPRDALAILHRLLSADGRLFLNVPVNSPAPDHIYLFSTPEELLKMILDAGFSIESSHLSPCTGESLERARKLKLTISVGVIARKS